MNPGGSATSRPRLSAASRKSIPRRTISDTDQMQQEGELCVERRVVRLNLARGVERSSRRPKVFLESPVPVTEERSDESRNDRGQAGDRDARLEGDAVVNLGLFTD